MSTQETPRTDAATFTLTWRSGQYWVSKPYAGTMDIVAAEDMARLERELAEAKKDIEATNIRWSMRGLTNEQLQAENDRLRGWKESQMAVESSWDSQKIGKLLDVPLGDSVRPRIEPAIAKLQAENAELREAKQRLMDAVMPLKGIGIATEEAECSLQSYNMAFYDCPNALVIYEDGMGNAITVGDLRDIRAALIKAKEGDQ